MDTTARRVISGLIGAAAGALAMGFVIGMITLFIGAPLGAILGYGLGFYWGFKRVDEPTQTATPRTAGDTAILVGVGSGVFWLIVAVSDLFFGYSGAYKGHMLGWLLPLLGLLLAPWAAIVTERRAQRKWNLLQRDIGGSSLLFLLLLAICCWWRWAEARDQNRPYQNQPYRAAGNLSAQERSTVGSTAFGRI